MLPGWGWGVRGEGVVDSQCSVANGVGILGANFQREYLQAIHARYQRLGRRFKSKILDEFSVRCPATIASTPCACSTVRCVRRTGDPDPNPSITAQSPHC